MASALLLFTVPVKLGTSFAVPVTFGVPVRVEPRHNKLVSSRRSIRVAAKLICGGDLLLAPHYMYKVR